MKFCSFNKNIISIDLGSYETKIIIGKENKEEIQVNKAFSFLTPINAYENGYIRDMEKMIDRIKAEFINNKISTGICYLNIKSTAIITREILFPVIGEDELEGLLKYQLAEYLPMDASKYVAQHKIIEKIIDSDNEKLNVLVVAIPKDIVDMHYVLIRELGLKPAVMDYQSNGIWKLMNFADYFNNEITPSYKTIATIDLGYKSANITIVKKGAIQTNRVIDLGGEDLNDVTDISGITMFDAINKVFRYYLSKETGNEIDIILLYGGLSFIEGIDKSFLNYFSIPTVILDSIGRVNIKDDANKYINCIGAILRDDEV